MKSLRIKIFIFCLIGFFTFTLTGCKKEGAAEKAGKKIDQAVDSAKKKMEEATK